jgi:metal-responsive CopG/Arc/MetJ family transcriptional regulator
MREIKILLDPEVVEELDQIAAAVGVKRSFLIRKAVRLYLEQRSKP